MMKVKITLILIVVGLFAASCRTLEVAPPVTASRAVRDDLGRTVSVPGKITRVISLAPSVTEMIFFLGAGNRLVGVTTYCNYPAGATGVEKIGDTQTPNIERIIALKPQVVFVSTDSQLESFSKTLAEQDIAIYVTNANSLGDVFSSLEGIGDVLLGDRGVAEDLVRKLDVRAAMVSADTYALLDRHNGIRQRVFLQISNEPLFTIGKDSFLTSLIEEGGGVSVTKDVPTGYPKLSKETAAALNPDVIFLSDSEDNREPNAAFKNSNAVKNGRVYRINADIISRPGPRLVDALEEIASKLKENE